LEDGVECVRYDDGDERAGDGVKYIYIYGEAMQSERVCDLTD